MRERRQRDAGRGGEGSDLTGRGVVDGDARAQHSVLEAGLVERVAQGVAVFGVDRDDAALGLAQQLDRALEQQLALVEHEQRVGDLLDLAQHVRRHEHGAALIGERAHEQTDPADALGVEAVRRLVEHQHARVAQQRFGDRQAVLHTERQAADAHLGHLGQADDGEHFAHARGSDAHALGRFGEVLRHGLAARALESLERHHGADRRGRARDARILGAADRRAAPRGAQLAEQDAQGRGLARTVRPEERRDATRIDSSGQAVDRRCVAERHRHVGELDHLSVAHLGLLKLMRIFPSLRKVRCLWRSAPG